MGVQEKTTSKEISFLREEVKAISSIYRPSASEGELEAASWIKRRFEGLGLEAKIEIEQAHGTYWLPMAAGATAGVVGGIAALKGKRWLGGLLGAAGAAGIWDDLTIGRRLLRKLLPKNQTYNVSAEMGPRDAKNTVVFIGHHDAAHAGMVFHPGGPNLVEKIYPTAFEKTDTSPPLMWPVFGAPASVALGSLLGSKKLIKWGILSGLLTNLAMADIGRRKVVPGANDNASGVAALFGIARAFADGPPADTRVILLSVGSEESFMEGSQAWGKRHFPSLPKESTFFVCLDGVGSPHLLSMEGEGMMKMKEYPQDAKDFVTGVAADLGIDLLSGLRLRNASDGIVPLRAGYKTVFIASCTRRKQPINYHWPTDTHDVVTYETIEQSINLSAEMVRRLDQQWIF